MATHTYTTPRARHRLHARPARSIAQALTILFGLTFVVIGVAGFVPSLTDNAADITTRGPDSPAELFGIYQVSVVHNVMHIATGVIALLAANGPRMARTFLVVAGLAYLALFAAGMWIDLDSERNVLAVDHSGNWLHFGLGAAMFLLAMLPWPRRQHSEDHEIVVNADDDGA